MALYAAFLKVVGKAVLNVAGGGIAGDIICDVVPEVARKVRDWWAGDRSPKQQRAEVEALANAPPAEVRYVIGRVINEVAAGQPAAVKERLSVYLSLVPGAALASLRGAGVSPAAAYDAPEDIVPLLPAHLPRFKPGDRPLPGIDWELDELLGTGGFGEVWRARNPHFDAVEPVALKFCLDSSAKDRLLRHEAAVLNQVMRQGRHPGIVQLRQTYLSADPPCLEYEYISGGDLAGLIQSWGRARPPAEEVGRLVRQLAEVVAFAHRLSPPIVHRDLKPANVLVQADSPFPTLKVADFGIGGLAADRAVAAATRGVSHGNFLISALRGAHTPLYASPQQMRGDRPDPRDDVYSLGVIWYQMLTGDLRMGRPGGTRWAGRLAADGVPGPHVELLSACLEDDPADRPKDAKALTEALGALITPPSAPAPPVRPAAAPARAAAPAPPRPASSEVEVTEPCPDCAGPMKVRLNKAGGYFLGCAAFPACRGTRPPPPGLVERIKSGQGVPPAPPRLAVALPREVVNSRGMRFLLIPPGAFLMGSPAEESMRAVDEGAPRLVKIERPVYLGIFPVTQREYQAVMRGNPSHFNKKSGGPDHPVEQVTWKDADAFCTALSGLAEEKKSSRVYRLPTEAEWECACRSGSTTPFAFGATLTSAQANFDGTKPYGGAAAGTFRQATTKVDSFPANAWGLHDMHGNVWEWCSDWYSAGGERVLERVVRGGSWNSSGHMCRSARRHRYAPNFSGDNVGFRVALDVG